jgi:uncharacterized membrane protein
MAICDSEQLLATSTESSPRAISRSLVAEALLGGALVGFGRSRPGRLGAVARATGAGLVLAALMPAMARGVIRAGADRRRVRLRTTLLLDRSVHEVFAFCQNFENFPRVVQSLHCVTDFQDGRSRWEVLSPSGERVAWDSVVSKYVPNVVLGWRSVPGSPVDCAGLIRFAPTPAGGTRLVVEIRYDPGHTGFADAVRALVDVPREEQLRGDLSRANFYLRAGPTPPASAETREDSTSTTRSA